MYLTNAEHEAFVRGQATGLIPVDLPLPTNDNEIDELIFHTGILFSAKIGYRNANGKLRVKAIATFTEEHLNKLVSGAKLRLDYYPNMLEGLYNYFAFGPEIVAAEDLAGRLSLHQEKLSIHQIMKGFKLKYIPVERSETATHRQRAVLAEMILANRLSAITRREWENLTKAEASRIISTVPRQQVKLPETVVKQNHQRRITA